MKYSTAAFLIVLSFIVICIFGVMPFIINHIPGIISSFILAIGGAILLIVGVFLLLRWMGNHL